MALRIEMQRIRRVRRTMRRIAICCLAMLLTLSTGAQAAFAGNPHFIKNATSASLSGADLVTNFKEAGLESGSVETITTSATATTTYECVNNGGHNPSASNKTTTVTQISQSGEFKA